MMFTTSNMINPLGGKAILFLDSITGRVSTWCLLVAIPLVCGVVSFRYEWRFLGFALLIGCTALFFWAGFGLWFHAVMDVSTID